MTLTIGSTVYDVEATEGERADRVPYRLTGPRGAQYFAMRNVNDRSLLFLINAGLGRRYVPCEWLRELAPGELAVIR